MPGYTFEQFSDATRNGGAFAPKAARDVARRLRSSLSKAADALAQNPETKPLADSLRAYEQALKDVSARFDMRNRQKIREGLKKLSGFGEFLEQKTPSGASSYALAADALQTLGEDRKQFREDLSFVSATLELEIEAADLEKEAQAFVKQAPQAKQPPQAKQAPQAPAGGKEPPVGRQAPAGKEQPPAAPQPAPAEEEEYVRTEGAMNINEEWGWMGNAGQEEAETPEAETAAFSEIRVPGKEAPTAAEAYDHWQGRLGAYSFGDRLYRSVDAEPVAMAVDEKGRTYRNTDEIKAELAKPGRRLFVFQKDGSLPHALENRDGRLFVSDAEISGSNQLPEHDRFAPKRSLKATDIAEIPSYKAVKSSETYAKDWKLKLKSLNERIEKNETALKEEGKWDDKGEFGYIELNRPKPPRGVGTWLWRAAVKVATLGFGETAAFRQYKQDQKAYQAKIENHPKRMKALREKKKDLLDKRREYEKSLAQYSAQKEKLKSAYEAADPEGKKKEIQTYRAQTEVRMEGVADLLRSGKVTPDNVFANTWLKRSACAGRTKDDPQAVRDLKEYIVSRTVEEEVLKETMEDKEYSRARNERMTEMLNDGSGLRRMDNDRTFRDVMEAYGNKPIDPEAIYEKYTTLSLERDAQRNHPLNRLKAEREALIREFGQKPVAKECLPDVVRLLMLDSSIKTAEAYPKDPHEVTAKQKKDSEIALASIYKNRDLNEKITPARQNAMEKLSADAHNAGRTFTLDQMAGMVDSAARQIEQKQAKPGNAVPTV